MIAGIQGRIAVGAATLSLAACAPHAPGIADPVRVEAHCRPREARITSIRSVLTSLHDTVGDDRPSRGEITTAVSSGDGAIAYWTDQLLRLPETAARFGERDVYVRVRALAIPPAPTGATYRHVYLEARDHGTYGWFTMQANDIQNICIEGHKQT